MSIKKYLAHALIINFFVTTSLFAQERNNDFVNEKAFSGSTTPSEIIESLLSNKSIGKNDEFSVEIYIPAIKNGQQTDVSLDGLPVYNEDGYKISDVEIRIPFLLSNHKNKSSEVDVFSFIENINNVSSLLIGNNIEKTDPLLQANCAGFPLGTTITTTTNSCFSTVTNTYTCQSYNGVSNWYVTQSSYVRKRDLSGC